VRPRLRDEGTGQRRAPKVAVDAERREARPIARAASVAERRLPARAVQVCHQRLVCSWAWAGLGVRVASSRLRHGIQPNGQRTLRFARPTAPSVLPIMWLTGFDGSPPRHRRSRRRGRARDVWRALCVARLPPNSGDFRGSIGALLPSALELGICLWDAPPAQHPFSRGHRLRRSSLAIERTCSLFVSFDRMPTFGGCVYRRSATGPHTSVRSTANKTDIHRVGITPMSQACPDREKALNWRWPQIEKSLRQGSVMRLSSTTCALTDLGHADRVRSASLASAWAYRRLPRRPRSWRSTARSLLGNTWPSASRCTRGGGTPRRGRQPHRCIDCPSTPETRRLTTPRRLGWTPIRLLVGQPTPSSRRWRIR